MAGSVFQDTFLLSGRSSQTSNILFFFAKTVPICYQHFSDLLRLINFDKHLLEYSLKGTFSFANPIFNLFDTLCNVLREVFMSLTFY